MSKIFKKSLNEQEQKGLREGKGAGAALDLFLCRLFVTCAGSVAALKLVWH